MAAAPEAPPTRRPRQAVNRTLYVLSLVALLLPFASVRGCSSDEVKEYTGVELLGQPGGEFLVLAIVIALALLGLSFVRPAASAAARGLRQAGKALLCALAGLCVIIATGLASLFDRLTERSGLLLCLGCWGALYLLSLGRAFEHLAATRRARRIGYLVGAALLAVFLALLQGRPPQPWRTLRDVCGALLFLVPAALAVRLWLVRRKERSAAQRGPDGLARW
ncbi:MAG: hypothetical protein ACYTEZ_19315 [Planctomycetota bacterium]|jgi:hypothetical protein